ncbi:hypothetical protein L1987_85815 [Smallanthus sonchifolius]|uniref:Uncharacterized protein n=1 Tax=Smallanthus sonchifolius TaxID=185202 RepID=A0ACB8XY10_9ASTR|nr:hypothetical protein L1987_85815 [Smallanthus sonchifolius]
MPINRYQIRNVYSLADPELYKAADKDDPEALLEGVAMAGLVGVLRQLGDLAEQAHEDRELDDCYIKNTNMGLTSKLFHKFTSLYLMLNMISVLFDPKTIKFDQLLEWCSIKSLTTASLLMFAAEIFHDLHEELMATAARGHGLRVRVQQLESEIPPIERAFLSQTSHSAFFPNSGQIFAPKFSHLSSFIAGIDWHPTRQATQNLITMGDLPRFVMDSYEECRGPPRLFLLDKFDVGGAGACLKRFTDPSIFKVEASSYEIEIAETQREKKICQTKKKGSKWKGGGTPEVSQSSHAKLHQLFLEERVQTGATEAARRVKLKTRPKKFPFDSESGECYMNKLLNSPSRSHEVSPIPSNGSRLEDGGITGSALGSPMENTSPCVSSSKVAESQLSHADLEVDDNQITVDDEIHTDGLQNGYPSEDVASETDNYMDALATMESEVETSITQGTYSDANKNQLQSQLSDSQSIENSTASNDRNTSTTKGITGFGNSDTTSTSIECICPVGADSPPRPFACIEIPFRPRVPLVADNIPMTQNPGHNITNGTCIDMSKVSNVDQVARLGEGTSASNEVCSDHAEKLDSPRKSEEHQIYKKDTAKCASEHSGFLPIADGLSSFSFVRNLKGDLDNKYPNDSSIPMILLPNILETTNNQVKNDEENHRTDSVASSSQLVISRVDEMSSDTTFIDDIHAPEEQLKKKGDGVLVISDQVEARVLYSNRREIQSENSEIEPVTVADANTNECTDSSVLKEGTGTESEEREIESTYFDVNRDDGMGVGDDTKLEQIEVDSVNFDKEMSAAVLLPVDVDKHEDDGHSVSEQDSKESGEKEEVDELLVISPDNLDNNDVDSPSLNSKILQDQNHSSLVETDQKRVVDLPGLGSQPVDIGPCVSKVQLIDGAYEAAAFTESDNDLESKSPDHIDILEAAESSPLKDKVDQSNSQLHIQLPLESEGSQLVQRPRSPLIDAVAAHDKTKLRKVSDRETNQIPKVEERDTLLDQIRAKSINLKPAVQTRPIIQGANTNLRVAAILEKANAIRQAFAGSDDDESDNWSDS